MSCVCPECLNNWDGDGKCLYERIAELERERDAARDALRAVRSSFWLIGEPEWLDKMLSVENRCWNETGIAPPGRSVSMHAWCPPDDDRRENWAQWVNAERLEALALVDAALAASGGTAEARNG